MVVRTRPRTITRVFVLVALCLTALVLTSRSGAQGTLTVDESKIVVLLAREPGEVQFPINTTGKEIVTRIHLELLDTRDHVLATAEKVATVRQPTTVSIPLPFYVSKLKDSERRNLPWIRLRYRLTNESSVTTLSSGIVSLSQVAPEIFEVRVISASFLKEGALYNVRVQAINPINERPTPGVRILARVTLKHNENDIVLQGFGSTDADGSVTLKFQIPARFPEFPHEIESDGGELYIDARKGSLTAELTNEILVYQFPNILITPDKPIYQPGQTLHARALVYSPSGKPLPNQDVVFRVVDENDTTVFQSASKTSRFGVASIDWPIADNSKLGYYTINLDFSGTERNLGGRTTVRVSRYDLPNFSVKVAPNRLYYLSGQNAEVRVSGDYLFGQPVPRGRVRVVRESERHWSYENQKWITEEGESYEGELDTSGYFAAHVDLKKYFAELDESDDYNRFDDITFAAYLTDPTTNRTEQRRFDIRVTKEPIHAYVITNRYHFDTTGKVPIEFYVSTFYADGSPAQCTVDLTASQTEDGPATRATIQTNRLGFGLVRSLPTSKNWDASENIEVLLTARDRAGKKGTATEDLRTSNDPLLSIQTSKNIYRSGEPISVEIKTNFNDKLVIVELATDKAVLESRLLKPTNNRVQITFPFRGEFKDKVGIVAYPEDADSFGLVATKTVLYPENRQLTVAISPVQKSYRPGESAKVNFAVAAPNNSSLESALGVVVVDHAVGERAKTDRAFGNTYSNSLERLLSGSDSYGGLSLNKLRRLDMSKPVPRDIELVAGLVLEGSDYYPDFERDESYERHISVPFSGTVSTTLLPLKDALSRTYDQTRNYPREETMLRRILSDARIDFDQIRDPWGVPFHAVFKVDKQMDRMELVSSGPDKLSGTDDDFNGHVFNWPYFQTIGEAIDKAVKTYHERTGGFIRDQQTLNAEVKKFGFSVDDLKDRWGSLYEFKFSVSENRYLLKVQSAGPDGKPEEVDRWRTDDFELWTNSIDYFAETNAKIDSALTKWATAKNSLPFTEAELVAALKNSNIDFSTIVDPWGRPYQAKFRRQTTYSDIVKVLDAGQTKQQKLEVTPVTRQLQIIALMSWGEDGKRSTTDDFEVASYKKIVSEEAAASVIRSQFAGSIINTDGGGAIAGYITDVQGAAIRGAKVSATLGSQTVETTSGEDGSFVVSNLAAGTYQVSVEATAFKLARVEGVVVTASSITSMNVQLEVGATIETVTVSSSAPLIQTKQIQDLPLLVVNRARSRDLLIVTKSGTNQEAFTPRLREYFPETLVWEPELITDKQGRAQLDFKLADNITTWKLSVIGSNEDGEIGVAETDIRAFQPFFADLDPPRVLTEGDQISLPVVLRNYLDRKQNVDLELKPESWFTLLEGNRKRAEVPAGDSNRQTFDLKAIASIKDGKQRVTAVGSDSSDAIEKVVTVHPDGEERSESVSEMLDSSTSLSINLPQDAIANSARVELKLFPNLLTHVWESVEGIMQRPYGCAEQTISAAYPSLLVLRFDNENDSPLKKRARRYVEAGYQKLLNYQNSDGGFGYWTHGKGDIALTAYALRFLDDASAVIPVDASVAQDARDWLLKEQRKDGSWPAKSWDNQEDQRRTAMVTALVTRSLVKSSVKNEEQDKAIELALDYLKQRSQQIDEPYLIATYSLLASRAGQTVEAARANERLRKLAHSEAGTTYWSLETNTPFYGWGTAGRVETTALALQALMKHRVEGNEKLEATALLFLLRNKDQYGVWYSTQATVNVLEAMLMFLTERKKGSTVSAPRVEVIVNGESFKTIDLPSDKELLAPLSLDITSVVKPGSNRVELRSSDSAQVASVQVVSNYYATWKTANSSKVRFGDSEALRLETSFSKYSAKVMEEITCRVKAERVGFSGYGMMLAEIGLPPGSDVDRASLESAMTASNWAIGQYDILPDRIVLYLWPPAGGVEFSFKFKPRFPMTAKAAGSTIYDYYNPEARASVAPGTFTIK